MNCPNCGAPKSGSTCAYCGARLSSESTTAHTNTTPSSTHIFHALFDSDSIECEFTAYGLECCVRRIPFGHRCGYVAIPKSHPLHGVTLENLYDIEVPAVDGGVTFTRQLHDMWVLGWDASHCWHRPDPSIMDERQKSMYANQPWLYSHDDNTIMIDADMAIDETSKFAKGLAAMSSTTVGV